MGTWLNADGLYIKYGKDEAASQDTTKSPAGEYKTYGEVRVEEIVVDLTKLNTSTNTILNDVTTFGKNASIEEVTLEVQDAATSGGAATLDVGLVRTDRSTELDYNGLVAAVALADIDAEGNRVTLVGGSSGAGALVGGTVANPGLFTAKAGTAVFTGGKLRIRVKWYAV